MAATVPGPRLQPPALEQSGASHSQLEVSEAASDILQALQNVHDSILGRLDVLDRDVQRALRPSTMAHDGLAATVPRLPPPVHGLPNGNGLQNLGLNVRQRMPYPVQMLGTVRQVPTTQPQSPLLGSCMVTPRVPMSGQLSAVPGHAPDHAPGRALAPVPVPVPARPDVNVKPHTEDRNDARFWQMQLDTSFSVASTVTQTPLSPSPVKVDSSYAPAPRLAPSVTSGYESMPSKPFAPEIVPPTSLRSSFQNAVSRSPPSDTTAKTELLKPKLSRLADVVVDPYEGLRLTPINDQPFQAIASIARQAQQSLVDRFLSR